MFDLSTKVIYLHHSSFAVKTASHFFIFDYYMDIPHGGSLAEGVINPEEISDENVVVFTSHHHPDHYSPRIFRWRSKVGRIRYVLSGDIKTSEEVSFIKAGQKIDLGDLQVSALKSTDIGVAFLIKADGLCIYHAGDLNWWKWNEDTKAEQKQAGENFMAQIDLLKGEKIDLAFLPADPRQGSDALLGFDYFMRTVGAKYAVPMHSFGQTDFFRCLKTDGRTAEYRDRIWIYSKRGDKMSF